MLPTDAREPKPGVHQPASHEFPVNKLFFHHFHSTPLSQIMMDGKDGSYFHSRY